MVQQTVGVGEPGRTGQPSGSSPLGGGASDACSATLYDSPIGELAVAVDAIGVVGLRLPKRGGSGPTMGDTRGLDDGRLRWESTPDTTAEVVHALDRYFEGDEDAFRGLALAPRGTPFQMAVWEACARIPFGETSTYGELAMAVRRPQAARAVGGAMNRNPLAIIVPCHRVVGASGQLTGYGGGLGQKEWLLQHEGIVFGSR